WRAETSVVGVIEAAAFRLARSLGSNLYFQKGADEGIILRFEAAQIVALRRGLEPQAASLLHQQFAHRQRPRRRFPRAFRIGCGLVLDYVRNGFGADLDAVDPYISKRRRGRQGDIRPTAATARLAGAR